MQHSRATVDCNDFPAVSSALLKKFPAVYIIQRHLPLHRNTHVTGQMKLVHIRISCLVVSYFNHVTRFYSSGFQGDVEKCEYFWCEHVWFLTCLNLISISTAIRQRAGQPENQCSISDRVGDICLLYSIHQFWGSHCILQKEKRGSLRPTQAGSLATHCFLHIVDVKNI